jgi:hypothetical protein
MANLRQIPSILRGNDPAGFAAKEIQPSIKRTMTSVVRAEHSGPQKCKNGGHRSKACSWRVAGGKESLSLMKSSPASVETPLKKLLAFLRA